MKSIFIQTLYGKCVLVHPVQDTASQTINQNLQKLGFYCSLKFNITESTKSDFVKNSLSLYTFFTLYIVSVGRGHSKNRNIILLQREKFGLIQTSCQSFDTKTQYVFRDTSSLLHEQIQGSLIQAHSCVVITSGKSHSHVHMHCDTLRRGLFTLQQIITGEIKLNETQKHNIIFLI